MAILSSFTFLSLDGYYKGVSDDTSWHQHGQEEAEFAAEGAQSQSILLFGRKTYEMMASFWPTEQAMQMMPETAKGMNESQKIVCSNTLKTANWSNTSIFSGDVVSQRAELKTTTTHNITILGSGSLVRLLSEHGLIDLYQIMIDPVVIGKGTSLFEGLTKQLNLQLDTSRVFKSGVVLLNYQKKLT